MNRTVATVFALVLALCSSSGHAVTKFNASGTAIVDGKPFFPVGIYIYDFNSNILAEVHEQGFNTVVYAVKPSDLDTLKQHGLMTVPYAKDEWLAVKNHPSILSWYLADEPEGWSQTPAQMKQEHDRIKAIDPNHPIGLCHYLWDAFTNYKDASDFVLSDMYPITAQRDQPITSVAAHIDRLHEIHGKGFPVWPVIQCFGGPDTDGGKWAEPTPTEVRCMTYMALAHGAKAMFFFSYWPKLPRTWAQVGVLTREIHQLTPFLLLPSTELPATSSSKEIHTRCIKVGNAGIVLAVNTSPVFRTATLTLAGVRARSLALPFEGRQMRLKGGQLTDRFMPHEVHVYQWGETPQMP